MSIFVCCLLVSVAWYVLGVLPYKRALAVERQKALLAQQQLAAATVAPGAKPATPTDQPPGPKVVPAIVTVNSTPAGTATIGDRTMPTPAKFDQVAPGKVTLILKADGYEDYTQDITVGADKPTDLGTIALKRSLGSIALTSSQSDVSYSLSGPDGYTHDGPVPDKLSDLPAGTYTLSAHQKDWQLQPQTVVLHGNQVLQQEIKFPFGALALTSTPPGATVREGMDVLGKTPLNLSNLKPGPLNLSIDLPPFTIQRLPLQIGENDNVTKSVALQKGRDFVAACGLDMVFVPDGYWVDKYELTQKIFAAVMGANPSSFRHPDHPVDSVTWEQAMAFCEKLNQTEAKAGKLPQGYRYTLPTETQWETFSADANLDFAATSRQGTLSSTQAVGFSEPNKYGLYDTLGNVWEWCLDTRDDKGAHALRGGSWLSSDENFPNAETRSAGAAGYSDRFTGFRVVLVAP